MKKRTVVICIILLLLVLCIPIPQLGWKDGGTRTYSAIAYRIVDYSHNEFVYPKEMQRVHVQFFPRNFGPWPEVEYRA